MDIDLEKFLVRLTGKARASPQTWERRLTELVTFAACHGLSIGAPLAFVSAAYILLWGRLSTSLELGLSIWSSTEIIFYLYCRYLLSILERPSPELQTNDRGRKKVVDEIIEGSLCPKATISKWFVPDPGQDLCRDDIIFWFSWAFFGKRADGLTLAEKKEAKAFLRRVEKKSGPCKYDTRPSGPGNSVVTNLMPVLTQHKPLAFYMAVYIIHGLGNCALFLMGFQRLHLQEQKINYWVYESNSRNESEAPLFFVHGIGLGLVPYLKQLYDLQCKYPGRMILAIEIPYISMIPISRPHSVDATLSAIDAIFQNHNIENCSWICHSFGTFITSWVVAFRPQYFRSLSMVDPVCFAAWESDLMHNFFHTQSRSLVQRITHFYLAKDIFLAASVQRFFFWHQSVLLPDNITFPTTVFLSEHDFLINSSSVESYLARVKDRLPHIPFTVNTIKDFTHGSFLLTERYADMFYQNI